MSVERLARASLALDAAYCAFLGLTAIVFRGRIGGLVGLPGVVIGALGAAVVGWAYVVLGQAVRMDWRRGIKEMVAANSVVAQTLALLRRDEDQAQPRSTPPRGRSSPAGRAPARDLRTV